MLFVVLANLCLLAALTVYWRDYHRARDQAIADGTYSRSWPMQDRSTVMSRLKRSPLMIAMYVAAGIFLALAGYETFFH